jgi:hypothetical protein
MVSDIDLANARTNAEWLRRKNLGASGKMMDELVDEIKRLREEMRTMHKSVVHDCCVAVQQVTALCDASKDDAYSVVAVRRVRKALVVEPVEESS